MQKARSIVPLRLSPTAPRFLLLALALASAFLLMPLGGRHATAAQTRQVVVHPPGPFEIRLPSRSFTPTEELPVWSHLFPKPKSLRVHAIVQLYEIPGQQTRAALSTAGISLGQPLTGRAYIATVKRGISPSAPSSQKLRWAGPLLIEDKLAPELQRPELISWARRVTGRVELVVNVFPDADFASATKSAKDLGGTILGEARAASVFAVSLPLGRERELARDDDILFIEPMPAPAKGESDRTRTHVHADVGPIPPGHPTGQGVIVAIFDGAHVRTTHPDFGTRVVQGDTGTYDPEGHPTMTAGMIAGDGSQSLAQGSSVANQWRGIAPASQVRSYNYADPTANYVTNYLNDVTRAVQTDSVVVMNNSWGDYGCLTYPYGAYDGRAPFLDGVIRGSLGRPVPIVFSGGNERAGYPNSNGVNQTNCITNTAAPYANYTTLNHPKSAKNIIAVGAIDSFNNAMSAFSSWGPTLDGRIKPDVVASGLNNGTLSNGVSQITNAFGMPVGSANEQDYRIPYYQLNNPYVYGWFSETSCAASIVSGGIALMLDDWRRKFPTAGAPLPSTLRALLVHNAFDLNDPTTTWYKPGPDYASGYGLVQINETLQSLERGDAYQGLVFNQATTTCPVTVPAGTTHFKVTLAWDDPPAIVNANPALIDDLDLVVTDPSGTRQYPWTLDPANPTAPAVRTKEDHVNNLEQVQVDTPLAGAWTVVVRGTNVPQSWQRFSLVSANGLKCPSAPNPPTNLNVVVQ
jgi:Subtilase family